MQNLVLNFLKKNWLYIVLCITLFFIGFKLFYSNKTVELLNKTIIEKEYANKLLNEQLIKQKHVSDSLRINVDVYYKKWKESSTSQVINVINNKYDKERVKVINANTDKQFSIFTGWLSEKTCN